MKKHFHALLLIFMVTAIVGTSAQAAFSDTKGHWAEAAISRWSEQYHIINGYADGTFGPDKSITRGEMAVIFDRTMRYQAKSAATAFTDTKGAWCEDAVLKLNAAGVMLGSEGKALWNTGIIRQEAVTMIARGFGIAESTAALTYADAQTVSAYAGGYVAAMTELGYINDTKDNLFRPRDLITRAELVNILSNMVAVLYQETGEYSWDAPGSVMVNAAGGATITAGKIQGDLIIAPGVTDAPVILAGTTVGGKIRNFSKLEPTITERKEEKPGLPPLVSDVKDGVITYSGKKIPIKTDVKASTLDPAAFGTQNGRMTYDDGVTRGRFGIDVSAHQNRNCKNNTIDWNAVAGDGVEFAMVRVGLRGTGAEGKLSADQFYVQNIDGAMAAGIETGAYFFSQATTVDEALAEADLVVELLKEHPVSGPVAYDWEMSNGYRVYGTTPEMATACAQAFCERIAAAGYKPMVYFSKYVGYLKYDLSVLQQYPFWYPEYGKSAPSMYYAVNYWQYNDNGKIAGIDGRVDVNLQFVPK